MPGMIRHLLETASQDLTSKTEAMNAEIAASEELLESFSLGVSAEVEMGKDQSLGFGKMDGHWRLYCKSQDGQSPLTSVSRAVRVKASEHMEKLLAALLETVGSHVESVEAATARFREFNETLRRMRAEREDGGPPSSRVPE